MISRESYSLEHIQRLREGKRIDQQILERSIYALGLLEALVAVGAPITFKGGSSLMLLLERPMRLSTDVDVVVPPGADMSAFLGAASAIFPFKRMEEQARRGRNGIEKRHYKFYYDSPATGREFYILLDILFEEDHYARTERKPIANDLLVMTGEPLTIELPTADCILGDKLTAFAPHTTGIPFGIDKELEIIKQMYDVATLIDVSESYHDAKETFEAIAATEAAYRGIDLTPDDVADDVIESAACIAGRGQYAKEDYPLYLKGIRGIVNHIFGERLTAERAASLACKVMCYAACVKADTAFEAVLDPTEYMQDDIGQTRFAKLKAMRKLDATAFAYLVKTARILYGAKG